MAFSLINIIFICISQASDQPASYAKKAYWKKEDIGFKNFLELVRNYIGWYKTKIGAQMS